MKKIKIIGISLMGIIFLGISVLTFFSYSRISQLTLKISEIDKKIPTVILKGGIAPAERTEEKKINEIYLALTEKNLKTSESILSSVKWTYTFTGMVITLVAVVLGFLGIKYAFPNAVDKQIKEWIKSSEEINTIKKELKGTSKEANISLAWTYMDKGLEYYYRKNKELDRVIELTERSLSFLKKAFNFRPNNFDEIKLWGMIHGNLAYYYAEKKDVAKYKNALEYADEAYIIGKDYKVLDLIDNYIFTVVYYDVNDKRYVDKARELFETWGRILENEILTSEEDKEILNNYKKFFSEK